MQRRQGRNVIRHHLEVVRFSGVGDHGDDAVTVVAVFQRRIVVDDGRAVYHHRRVVAVVVGMRRDVVVIRVDARDRVETARSRGKENVGVIRVELFDGGGDVFPHRHGGRHRGLAAAAGRVIVVKL